MKNSVPTIFPTHFSPSMMDDVNRCHMSFFRQYIQCFVGTVKNPDLIAGGHIAKACEITRNAYFTDGMEPNLAIELGVEHILDGEDTGDSVKSNENVAFAFRKYFQKFRLDKALPACKLADGTHAVEYKFAFDLGIPHPDFPDRNIIFTGRLDYLCEKVEVGRILRYGLDEKTCKSVYRLPQSKVMDYKKETDQYRTYGPIIAYSWAARQLGVPLESFLIRRIPIMTTFEPAFEIEIPVTDFAIDQWYRSMYNNILELVEKYKMYKLYIENQEDKFPYEVFYPSLSNLACMSYSRPCPYTEGCLSSSGELLLQERFTQRIYDREKRIEVFLSDYVKGIEDAKKS